MSKRFTDTRKKMKRWDKPDSDVIGDIEEAIKAAPRATYRYDPELRKTILANVPKTHLVWDEKLEAYVREEVVE